MVGSKVMVVLVVCLVCLITTTYSNTPSRIINGQKADKGEFPFIVSVETIGHFCGGTILDEYWILTAAHCVQDPDGSDAFAASDMVIITDAEDDWYPDGTKYQVDSFYPHESYNFSNSQENDIALIKLAEPIKFNDYVSAADLPIEDIDDNSGAMIAGWGATYEEEGEEDSASRFLNKVPVFTIETQDCDIKWQMGTDRIQPGQVCIHAYKKGEGACEGDSGGPLSVNNTVIGIGSFVISCGGTYPDVYTRVYHFLDWIKKTKENN